MKKLIFVYLLFAGLLVNAQESKDLIAPIITSAVKTIDVKNINTNQDTYIHSDNSWDVEVTDNHSASDKIQINYHLQGATQGNSSSLKGKEFNKGTTIVIVAAMDEAGNVSTKQFNILIIGEKIQFLDCPDTKLYDYTADRKGQFEYPTKKLNPTVNMDKVRDCSYSLYGVTTGYGNDLKGQNFNLGQTTVVWIVTDLNDKQGACLYDINVIENR